MAQIATFSPTNLLPEYWLPGSACKGYSWDISVIFVGRCETVKWIKNECHFQTSFIPFHLEFYQLPHRRVFPAFEESIGAVQSQTVQVGILFVPRIQQKYNQLTKCPLEKA